MRILITGASSRLAQAIATEEVVGQEKNLMWLNLRDAAQTFRCALNRDASQQIWWTQRWAMYHICADIPNPKFLIDQASHIGYKPTHNFQAHYQGA